ncbi:BnaC03g72050D [Brassica napus]|uniref:BnaC03g72050D protein n=1 Tax=Brassica napus TaxID=3708 RepID=A0A078J1N1_BRANA|nr:BnaC03g72050D [Brassica napus]
MEEELRDMKARKAHYDMLHFVADAQQGIPKLCPYTSSAKTSRFENDGMHFRQPWVMGVQQEVERLKIRVHEHEKLLRECDEVKAHVGMLLRRVSDLERVL